MDPIRKSLLLFCGLCALAFAATALMAQRTDNNNPPGDIKPAQAASPAANPTAPTNNGRNVIDRPRGVVQEETGLQGDRRRAENPRQSARGERGDREANLNRQLAACLLTKNKGEVELGKYAESRAKNNDVKEFAAQMINDHSEIVAKLERIVGSDMPSDRRSEIAKEIDEQCLESLKKELGDKSAGEFDACYIGSQIAGHMQMTAALKVLSKHATGELRDVITEAQPTVDKHLKHAKELMDKLEKSDHNAQASKDRSESKR
jgi:putative membrane protein